MYGFIGRALGGKVVALATAGALGAGIFGGVPAYGAAPTGDTAYVALAAADGAAVSAEDRGRKLRAILDRLVDKGVITRAQAGAILEAITTPLRHDDRGDRVRHLLRGALAAAARYLGVTADELRDQLRSGKSLGEIADATAGKSRDGLVAALTQAADARIDRAVAAGRLTADQAAKLKERAAAAIAKLVDRHWKAAPEPATG